MEGIIIEALKPLVSKYNLFYIFLIGFFYFLVFYLKRIKIFMKKWENMDSFSKIFFLFLLGFLVILPPFFISTIILSIITIFYFILAPHISAQPLDWFKSIFLAISFIYGLYILFKIYREEFNFDLIKKLISIGHIQLLFILAIIGFALNVTVGVITSAIIN